MAETRQHKKGSWRSEEGVSVIAIQAAIYKQQAPRQKKVKKQNCQIALCLLMTIVNNESVKFISIWLFIKNES
jgi:DICT domain-containing protein